LEVREKGESSSFYRGNPRKNLPPQRPCGPMAARRAVTGPRGPASARTWGVCATSASKTVSVDKCGCGRTSGRRPRTSRRKGRPDGHFHPKTSVMTSLAHTPVGGVHTLVEGRIRLCKGRIRWRRGAYAWRRGAYAWRRGAYAWWRGAYACVRGAYGRLWGAYGWLRGAYSPPRRVPPPPRLFAPPRERSRPPLCRARPLHMLEMLA
jgi:hypothetical protein